MRNKRQDRENPTNQGKKLQHESINKNLMKIASKPWYTKISWYTSTVAAILASKAGVLKELDDAMVPSLILLVIVESAARVVQHSRMELCLSIRWSSSHTEW